MTILAFLVITFGLGTAGLLTRRRPPISIAIGFVGLVAAVVSALFIAAGDHLVVGASALVATDFMRLFVLFGSIAALALCAMALAADAWQRNLPSAMLLGLGALALGLGLTDPVAGLAATAAAGLPGVLVAIRTPVDVRGVRSAARELRAVAVTGALAIVAAALVSGPSGLVNLPVTIAGAAYLAMALAVAVRFGAIPFHSRVARVTGSAPVAALPLLLAWAPAGFASAALVWVDGNIATTTIPLTWERIVIVGVGLLCILLGVVAATIQDDIEHVVGYSVVQDAGFVMLAFAVFQLDIWEPARTWLLIYVLTKSTFAGWALAMRASFGTSRIAELSGWARRAPALAIALAAIVVATVGVPGLLVFDARSRIADLALGSPIALLAIAGGFASLLYYGRLAKVGIGPVAPLVAAYPGIRPHGPGWVRAHATAAVGVITAEAPAASAGSVGAPVGAASAAVAVEPDAPGPGTPPADPGADEDDVTIQDPIDAAPGSGTAGTAGTGDGVDAAPGSGTAARQGGAGRTAAAAVGAASPRGPSADALRRDPKELTQAWAREALERAGLAPAGSGAGSPAPDDRPTEASGRDLAHGGGVRVTPPADATTPVDAPWSTTGAGTSSMGGVGPEDGTASDPGRRGGHRPRDRRRRPAEDGAEAQVATGRVRAGDLWAANRHLVLAVLALAMSAVGLAAAAGAFGVGEAASAAAPQSGAVQYGPAPAEGPSGPGDVTGPNGSPGPATPETGLPGGGDATTGTDVGAPEGGAGTAPAGGSTVPDGAGPNATAAGTSPAP